MGIILVAFLMLIILIIFWRQNRFEITSPVFLFVTPFILCLLVAFFYKDEWLLDLHFNTGFVLVLGVLFFCLGTLCVNLLKPKKQEDNDFNYSNRITEIGFIKYFIFFIFLIFVLFYKYYSFANMAGTYDIPSMMTIMRRGTVNGGTDFSFSPVLLLLGGLSFASGFVLSLILAEKIVNWKTDHKNWIIILLCIFVSIFTYLLGGARGGAYSIIGAFIYGLFASYYKKKHWKNRIPFKVVFFVLVALFIFMLEYKNLGMLMGKTYLEDYTNQDYISVYIGAQIKNLDIAMQWDYKSKVFGQETFQTFVQFFSSKFGSGEYSSYSLYLPFNSTNGYDIGNVYTTFYQFYIDFGYVGVAILPFSIGVISQITYNKTKIKNNRNILNIYNIVYSYMIYALIFSFFSDKFFEEIITLNFVRYFICMIIVQYFFIGINYSRKESSIVFGTIGDIN